MPRTVARLLRHARKCPNASRSPPLPRKSSSALTPPGESSQNPSYTIEGASAALGLREAQVCTLLEGLEQRGLNR